MSGEHIGEQKPIHPGDRLVKELGMDTAPCLMAKDDETFSYNHRINRLSTVQEHYAAPRHRPGRQP